MKRGNNEERRIFEIMHASVRLLLNGFTILNLSLSLSLSLSARVSQINACYRLPTIWAKKSANFLKMMQREIVVALSIITFS